MGDRDNLPELPKGWVWATFEQVSERVTVGHVGSMKNEYIEDGISFLRSQNVRENRFDPNGLKFISRKFHEQLKKSSLQPGDLVVVRSGSVGVACVIPETLKEANCSDLVIVKQPRAINPHYGAFYMNSIAQSRVKAQQVGIALTHFNTKSMAVMPVPVPPLAEQHRIVAKIDELFTQLDAGVELLKKLKAKLKRYRQAVLKAAVEGKLTKDWREAHQGELEPASVLLERILKERREKWEAEQLAQMKAKGKTPKDDSWKLKYKEPVIPNISDLPELPEGWEWISLDYVLSKIEAGKSFKCEERTPTVEEVGVVKVSAVTWGEFNEFESKTCLDLDRINPQLFVKEGDFLFSRANTIELVGACVIAKHVTRRVMLSDKILRFYFVEVSSKWILFALRTRLGRNEIERLSTGNQESMRNIGQERIRRIRISLPPTQEIQQIVSELERRFSVTDELEKVIEQNLKRAEKLRQSILKKAFEGKLVPQDSTDEPADKLLERIKAEKAKREAETKAKKKRKQPGKSQQLELF